MMRIQGLDAIRIVCAVVVAVGHFPIDFTQNLAPLLGQNAAATVNAILANSFNGPAAVIVFFVLSGLVIHLPYSAGRAFYWREFAARRYARIVPPVLVFVLIAFALGRPLGDWDWNNTVLWSVICELIYYSLYPMLRCIPASFTRQAFAAFGVALAFVAIAFILIGHYSLDYQSLGYLTFVVGLPAWLAGCALADHRLRFPVVNALTIWSMRIAIIVISIVLRVIKFHGETYIGGAASNLWLLTGFAIPTAIWLGFEARYYENRTNVTVRLLDKAGSASYSLYLVHPLVLTGLGLVVVWGSLPSFLIYIASVFVATGTFYLLAERPSHRLARMLGRRARARRESLHEVSTDV